MAHVTFVAGWFKAAECLEGRMTYLLGLPRARALHFHCAWPMGSVYFTFVEEWVNQKWLEH